MFTHTSTQTYTPATKEIYIVTIHRYKILTTHAKYTETKLMKRVYSKDISVSKICTLSPDVECTYRTYTKDLHGVCTLCKRHNLQLGCKPSKMTWSYRVYTNTCIHHVQRHNSDAKYTKTTWTHGYTCGIHPR